MVARTAGPALSGVRAEVKEKDGLKKQSAREYNRRHVSGPPDWYSCWLAFRAAKAGWRRTAGGQAPAPFLCTLDFGKQQAAQPHLRDGNPFRAHSAIEHVKLFLRSDDAVQSASGCR